MNKRKNRNAKTADWKFFVVSVVAFLGMAGAIFYFFAPRPGTDATRRETPRYFLTSEAAKPLPETLNPDEFSNKDVAAAYKAAKESPEVLAQQPCFCRCDRRMGHRSLLDCFSSRHAGACDVCVKEAIFAQRERDRGKGAAEIREEIINGAWKTVEIAK